MECLGEANRISGRERGTGGEDKDGERGVEPGFARVGTLLPPGNPGDAGMRSYQDRDDAASTDPVACEVQSPV